MDGELEDPGEVKTFRILAGTIHENYYYRQEWRYTIYIPAI